VIRRLLSSAFWLLAAAGIALGAAGLVSGMDHPPTGGGRGELTFGADATIRPGLDAATDDLRRLSEDVNRLADLGRTALTSLAARDLGGLKSSIDAGNRRIATIQADASALRDRLGALPGAGPGMTGRLGTETVARYATLVDALPVVDGLDESWGRLAAASIPATELTSHLLAHDRIAGQAVIAGSGGRYAAALKTLSQAKDELAAAKAIRDRLAATVDVTTLDDWIARNSAYDAAVGSLWQAMVTSKGRVTPEVRDSAAAAEAAKQMLPPDARALVVILSDVAAGGLNQAVVEVEKVRGPLLDAVAKASGGAPTQ
jgi:hypothetical protein